MTFIMQYFHTKFTAFVVFAYVYDTTISVDTRNLFFLIYKKGKALKRGEREAA